MVSSHRPRPFRSLTTARFLLASAVIFFVGLYCLYLGSEQTKFWQEQGTLRAFMENLGGLLVVTGIVGVMWDLFGRRSFAREVLESARTAAEIETAGLLSVGAHYLDDAGWADLFRGTEKLDVFVAYANTWRNVNLTRLETLAKKSNGRIRIYLADPKDDYTVKALAPRFDMSVPDLQRKIEETKVEFERMRDPSGASIEVFYWKGDRVFAFYRFDTRAVLTLYKHAAGRSPILPTIVCESGGSIYEFIYKELNAIRGNSRPA